MGASKTFSLVALLLLTTYLNHAVGESITVTSSQISTTATTNTDSTLESNQCSCDLFSAICDNLCCCDSNCPSDSVSAWKTQGLCTNQEYFYSLSNIPKCSDSRPKTIDDLQGGLRIYYQILKILFCIVFDNSKASDLFKGFQSTSDINQAISVAASDTPASATSVYVESPSTGSTFTRVSAYRPSFGSSMCSSQNIVLGTNLESEDCYLTPTTLAAFCVSTNTAINPATYNSSSLSIRKAAGSSATATLTVNAFNRDLTSTSTGYSIGTASTLLALIPTEASVSGSTTDCTCTNYVSEVNYRFVVDSNNLIQSAAIDVVVTTTAETFTCSSPVIKQTTSVYFLTAAADYPSLKGPAYRLGDPVLLGLKSGTTFTLFVEPLSFTYMTSAGQCALTTDTADPKYSSTIQFGYLNTFSCSLSFATSTAFSTFCESPETLAMYANVINNIQYIGIYPNSNPAYSLEWYGITAYTAASLGGSQSATTTCVIQAPIISVFYSVIGEQTKPGYKINSATITQADSETFTYTSSSQVFNFKLYVDFIQLDQSSEFFVAPNPTASVSVPDNVLTPFITKKTSSTTTTTTL